MGLLRGPAHGQRQARACTTCGPASTRTSSAASAPWTATTWPAGPGGTPTGCPSRSRSRSSSASPGKQQIEDEVGHRRVHPPVPRVGATPTSGTSPASPQRIGYWVDMDAAYWTLQPRLRRVGLVAPPAALRPGAALRGPQGRPLLPALRHGAVQPRARPARRLLATRRTSRPTSAFALVDPDPDRSRRGRRGSPCGPRRRGRCSSNTGVAVNPELVYAVVDGTLVAAELVDVGVRRGGGGRVTARVPGSAWWACATCAPSTTSPPPHGADGWRVVPADYVTTEEGTGLVHLAPAFGEIDRQIGRANGLPSLNPVGPDGALHRRRWPGWPGARCARPTTTSTTGSRRPGCCCAASPTCTPTRTAGGAAPPLIYWGKPSWYIATSTPQGRPAGRQPTASTGTRPTSRTAASASGWTTTSTGPCRATATGGRRCPSGAAAAATCAASARWPSSPSCAAATCRRSTPTARPSTR